MKNPAKNQNPTTSKKETPAKALEGSQVKKGARPTNARKNSPAETAILAALASLQRVTITRVGAWFWLGGNTYSNRAAIRAAGCRWDNGKGRWYWRPEFAARAEA